MQFVWGGTICFCYKVRWGWAEGFEKKFKFITMKAVEEKRRILANYSFRQFNFKIDECFIFHSPG